MKLRKQITQMGKKGFGAVPVIDVGLRCQTVDFLTTVYTVGNHRITASILPDSADNLPGHSAILPGKIDPKLFCPQHYLRVVPPNRCYTEAVEHGCICVFKKKRKAKKKKDKIRGLLLTSLIPRQCQCHRYPKISSCPFSPTDLGSR
jgi:hypothetical protein